MLQEFFKIGAELAFQEERDKTAGLASSLRAPLIGAGLGAGAGLGVAYLQDSSPDKKELLRNAGIGATAGAGLGALRAAAGPRVREWATRRAELGMDDVLDSLESLYT